tara:strand:- start:8268 stop:9620 length:1353 start_codon:yes stop_codon:yes gene_type:complete
VSVAAAKNSLTNHIDGLRRSDLWLEGYSGVLVAVSGGPDSLALTFVAAEICVEKKINFEAVVVDHGLRSEAAGEASKVVGTLKSRGIRSCCLRITAPPPSSGKQAWAREQRMQLLCDYARQTASAVLFAHHYDDQAETVAMRLARGSAVMGLSAIAAVRIYQGVLFVRPFLNLHKIDLIAVCKVYKAEFITDPSNKDQAFERARIRAWLQQPDQRLLQQQLVQLSRFSAQLSERLADTLAEWCAEHIVFTLRLRAQINFVTFSELSGAKQNLILRHCLAVIGGQPYPLSDNRLDRLRARLATGVRLTAGDCIVQCNAERITIMAEFGRMPEPELHVQAGRIYRFDKRWLIRTTKDGVIRRLGPAGWAKRSKSSNFQTLSDWTARMGAMIPVLHGLDGRRYCPHFIERRFIYSDFAFNSAQQDLAATRVFCASSLPLDGPCEVIKTDKNDR